MKPCVSSVVRRPQWLWLGVLVAGLVWCEGASSLSQGGGTPRPKEREVQAGEVILRATIGAGREQVGCEAPEEGAPQGPMSFAVAEDETIYVLDQVNDRIQVYRNNSWLRSLPLPSTGAVDLEVCPWGQVAVLDNLLAKALFVLDASSGAVLHRIALEGKNVAYAPAVTSVFCRGSGPYAGLWVEVEERAVRLATAGGMPDRERISLPGTLTARGDRLVRAEISGEVTVMLFRSREKFSQWQQYPVTFASRVDHLTAVSVDAAGNAYLGAFLEDEGAVANVLVKLDAKGKEVRRLNLPVQQRPEEVYRSLKASPRGTVYQLLVEEAEVVVRRYQL